jgi:HAD superfamily hydrolase (TIGR01509 family)
MIPTPELVIFDCDGVLVDSELIACESVVMCLNDAGLHMSLDEVIRSYMGVSTKTMMDDLTQRFGPCLPVNFADVVTRRTREGFDSKLKAIDGAAQVLQSIPFRICVASSSPPERILHSLEITRLLNFFDGNIFSATQVAHGKPAPDLFLFTARQMSVPPRDCVVVEDSIPGVRAACAAGMRVLGFTGGSHCRPGHGDSLQEAGAMETFNTMAELPMLLAN